MSTPDTPAAPGPPPHRLRDTLARFATGVTVVTCHADGAPHGATVNAFTSVSLDPPLVLVALSRRARVAELLDGRPFVVNVLAEAQHDLALHFAGRPRDEPVEWVDPTGEHPRLPGVVGALHCRPWATYDGGDHVLHLGAVEHVEAHDHAPLLFFRGEFPRLEHDPEHTPWFGSLDGPAAVRHDARLHPTIGAAR